MDIILPNLTGWLAKTSEEYLINGKFTFYIFLLFLTVSSRPSFALELNNSPDVTQRHFTIDDPATEETTDDITIDIIHMNPEAAPDIQPKITEFFPEADPSNSEIIYVNLTKPNQQTVLDSDNVRLNQTINISNDNLHLTAVKATFVAGMVLYAVFQSTGYLGKTVYSAILPTMVTAYLAISNPGYREWLIGEKLSPYMGRIPLPGFRRIPLPFIMDPTEPTSQKIASLPMQAGKMAGFLAVYLSLLSLSDKVYDYTFDGVEYLNSLGSFYSFADLKKIGASLVEALPAEMIFLSLNGQVSKQAFLANPTPENLRHIEKWSARASAVVAAFLTAGQVATVISDNVVVSIGGYNLNEGSILLHGASILGASAYFLKLTPTGKKITSAIKSGCRSLFSRSN